MMTAENSRNNPTHSPATTANQSQHLDRKDRYRAPKYGVGDPLMESVGLNALSLCYQMLNLAVWEETIYAADLAQVVLTPLQK